MLLLSAYLCEACACSESPSGSIWQRYAIACHHSLPAPGKGTLLHCHAIPSRSIRQRYTTACHHSLGCIWQKFTIACHDSLPASGKGRLQHAITACLHLAKVPCCMSSRAACIWQLLLLSASFCEAFACFESPAPQSASACQRYAVAC